MAERRLCQAGWAAGDEKTRFVHEAQAASLRECDRPQESNEPGDAKAAPFSLMGAW